jgi:hypothetical protein
MRNVGALPRLIKSQIVRTERPTNWQAVRSLAASGRKPSRSLENPDDPSGELMRCDGRILERVGVARAAVGCVCEPCSVLQFAGSPAAANGAAAWTAAE